MAKSEGKDPAEVRREKLQALKQRRQQTGRKAAPAAAGPGGREPGGLGRRAALARRGGAGGPQGGGGPRQQGGGGAGQQGGDKRAALMAALRDNPEKRKELLERFPQLRERLMSRRGGGEATAAGAMAGAKPEGGEDGLDSEVRDLRLRVAELDEALRKTQRELEALRAQAPAPKTAARAKVTAVRKTTRKK